MSSALITEIQRFSIHDGPGIRTTVFVKGCPLSCAWCHNPECISFDPEVLVYPQKCIGCGRCAEGCYAGARVPCGKRMRAEEVLEQILQDLPYYGNEGGMTLSGGEPLAHAAFSAELLRLCRKKKIGTAMESSLYRFDGEIFSLLDWLMVDIKHMDDDQHRRYTGHSNKEILSNIKRVDEMGIPMIVRTPVVPGVNDSAENITATAAFVRNLKNVVRYELLPYHPLGLAKAKALGRSMREFTVPSEEQMKVMRKYADIQG